MGLFNPGFSKLYLQPMLLQEASNALKVYAHNNEKSSGHTATVHARWLEGECETRQKAGQTYCRVGDKDFFTYESCAYTEEYIKQHLPLALSKASIVLCADQEHPLSEETFHNIDTHSLLPQDWSKIGYKRIPSLFPLVDDVAFQPQARHPVSSQAHQVAARL